MNELLKKNFFSLLLIVLFSLFIFSLALADLNKKDKEKAWDCVGIYMANYFLPSGEKFEYGMKEKNKNIKIYLSDPAGSSLYNYIENGELKSEGNSITEGIGSSRVTANFAEAKIDGAFSIEDKESLPVIYDLIQNEGLSLGTSCGVNIAGAIRLGKKLGPGKTIVTILCDRSDKYNSKLFNRKFLEEKGLPIPAWI